MSDLEDIVKKYYRAVDENNLDILFSLFSNDIIYERPGYEPLKGMEEFQNFYRSSRIIKSGHHTIFNIIVKEPYVVVEGEFNGVLKNGNRSYTKFVDVYKFHNEKICFRHTYFDGANV